MTCVTPKPKDDAPGKDELEEYLAMPPEDPDETDRPQVVAEA